jgi:hypothetical protein
MQESQATMELALQREREVERLQGEIAILGLRCVDALLKLDADWQRKTTTGERWQ